MVKSPQENTQAQGQQPPPQKPSRQNSGLACNECRARKLRCDRVKPTCGICANLGITCNPNTGRQPRGPRKGHLKALQSRILALERQLGHEGEGSPPPGEDGDHEGVEHRSAPASEDEAQEPPQRQARAPSMSQLTIEPMALAKPAQIDTEELTATQSLQPTTFQPSFFPGPASDNSMMEHFGSTQLLPDMVNCFPLTPDFDPSTFVMTKSSTNDSLASMPTGPSTRSSISMTPPLQIPDLMKADLNHLYFDRVHLFAPILNKRRYFARATQPLSASSAFSTLQYAMWTVTAWLTSQFKDVQKSLYAQTRAMLSEEWENQDANSSTPIEFAQAWVLLSIYEIMQVTFERGWLSAGRCFRLVQCMKLHEVDMPSKDSDCKFSGVETEERRRTFWMAYSLDRFINLVNQMPLTLNEQVILTRLPSPEADFQREQVVKTRFLSEVITNDEDNVETVSPFNACIVLATISGRCLSHQQQCQVEHAYGDTSQGFATRHQWLENLLAVNIKTMLGGLSGNMEDEEPTDPLLLFTSMMAQATVLSLGKAMQDYRALTPEYEQKVQSAAKSVDQLAKKLSQFGPYKIHPFTPIPLLFCAEFAQRRRYHDLALNELYSFMASSLGDLSAVNALAKTCLDKLNSSDCSVDEEMKG